MIRTRKRRPVQPHVTFADARPNSLSSVVHPCPLQSKELDDGAKTGCIHPDFLKMPRLCPEALLST
jgi:hypothetical protein